MPGDYTWHTVRSQVRVQVNFVHAPLPVGPGVCEVCRGATDPRYRRCYACNTTVRASGGLVSDLVVPISYRFKDGQHAHDLRMYKKDAPGTAEARKRLASLFWYFCGRHITCVKEAAGVVSFSHVCFVPSTKTPDVVHPLQRMLAADIPLERIDLGVNRSVSADRRCFIADWFTMKENPRLGEAADVLLIEDTWVSGARMQSAAHCLKKAGARRVVSLVLARQLEPSFTHAEPLIRSATRTRFDPETCVVHPPET